MKYESPILSDTQREALEIINEAKEVSFNTYGHNDYYYFNQKKLLAKDLWYLTEQALIKRQSSVGKCKYIIADSGKAFLAGEWEDPNAAQNDEYLNQNFENQDFEPSEITEKASRMSDEIIKHESFGTVGLSHRQGDTYLFNSTVRQFNTVSLRICKAELHRSLHEDRVCEGKTLIEIEMSHDQLLNLLFTPNQGTGSSCTIRYINGEKVENPPKPENKRGQFSKEFKESLTKAYHTSNSLQEEANRLLNRAGTLKKAEKERLLSLLNAIGNATKSNLVFSEQQFQEQMDKSVSEANIQVQGAVNATLQNMGLAALQDKVNTPQLEG